MQRRQFIIGAGALSVITVGGVSYCAVAKVPKHAYQPWEPSAEVPDDIRLDAFRYAILAPNPHNRQPWLIELRDDYEALLFCDLDKRLPVTDPFDRQITIGFGTFIELASIAASKRGFGVRVEPFPDGAPIERLDKRPIARLTFAKSADIKVDSLFDSVLQRRSNKMIYDSNRKIETDALDRLSKLGATTIDHATIIAAKSIIQQAIEIEMRTPLAHKESVNLMRIGSDEIERSPDGIALVGAKIETARALGFISTKSMLKPESTAFKTGLKQQLEVHGSVPGLFWISTPGNERQQQIEAGRRYMRANLTATSLGVAMHPVSQSLQEYPELEGSNSAIHQLLLGERKTANGDRIQMLARIGYATSAMPPAPRWPIEKHLI